VFRAPVWLAGRRAVVSAAAVLAAVLLAVVLVAGWATGGSSNVTYVDGSKSAVLYAAGHQPVAPDFTGTTLTGTRLNFAAYRGQVVVLNFWGSWCVPCRAEATTLAAVAALYRSSGVSFLGVDEQDTTASAQAFTRSFGITYPSVTDPGSAITADFTPVVSIAATPTTLVIGRNGRIAGAVFGPASYPVLTTILAKVTGKTATEAVSR
jgi:thiol-disulfide isomerase/thioredoxin